MKDHLFFCGIKHSGKSTLGAFYARANNLAWVDLDDLILKAIAPWTSVRAYYKQEGQMAFQAQEVAALETYLCSHHERTVISLGGGASDNEALLSLAKSRGRLIYLMVEEGVLFRRIISGGIPPFLDESDPKASFHALYARRHAIYGNICDVLVQLPNYPDIRDTASFLVETLKSEV
ncbi:shikimate kinase [Sphaerochaeta globosa]|uniref:Shikimate kinase n=1 Tax=Sphaerochaeta globosa (strain ATCC BAA-1886 / DSM 22777 / Buddy) TaxID=158189 RepID=F0RYR7_SPHGB|nr:shikimate kinase [Sphaerochaeta globosa]ADY13053.1 Shikimate kinase [Sphaerochaeta globosa str. Buddy]